MLDGTRESLVAALNTLEIFGTLSGLRVNMDKTKLVWLGKKKHSKDKFNIDFNLEWNATEFKLLGIMFSVDLHKIPNLNFEPLLGKVKSILSTWKKRHLTPLGKITVLKTFILASFNHLFTVLPTPSDYLLQELTNLFYSFLWDNKPDKINRKQICCNYNDGGLKMVNIKAYIISQKLSWIRRLFNNNNAPWIQYLRIFLKIPYLFTTGSQWSNIQSKRIKNPFWRDVVGCWSSFIDRSVSFTKNAEMTLPIWGNPLFFKDYLCFSKWISKGITYLADIINESGTIMDCQVIESKYNLTINFLEYYRLRSSEFYGPQKPDMHQALYSIHFQNP